MLNIKNLSETTKTSFSFISAKVSSYSRQKRSDKILTKQLALKTDDIDPTKNTSQIKEKILFSADATM